MDCLCLEDLNRKKKNKLFSNRTKGFLSSPSLSLGQMFVCLPLHLSPLEIKHTPAETVSQLEY